MSPLLHNCRFILIQLGQVFNQKSDPAGLQSSGARRVIGAVRGGLHGIDNEVDGDQELAFRPRPFGPRYVVARKAVGAGRKAPASWPA